MEPPLHAQGSGQRQIPEGFLKETALNLGHEDREYLEKEHSHDALFNPESCPLLGTSLPRYSLVLLPVIMSPSKERALQTKAMQCDEHMSLIHLKSISSPYQSRQEVSSLCFHVLVTSRWQKF